MGLLAQLVASSFGVEARRVPRARWRLPTCALCIALLFIHLGLAPRALTRAATAIEESASDVRKIAASFPSDVVPPFHTVLILSTQSYASLTYGVLTRLANDDPYFCRTMVLGSGPYPIQLHRPDSSTLLMRPEQGFLAPLERGEPGRSAERLLFDQRQLLHSVDRMYRDGTPMTVGQQISLAGITVEITELTVDGRPAEAAFHFAMDLENSLLRWLKWDNGRFVSAELPAVGQTVTIPAPAATDRADRPETEGNSEGPAGRGADALVSSVGIFKNIDNI
jgi:hypothetical protein